MVYRARADDASLCAVIQMGVRISSAQYEAMTTAWMMRGTIEAVAEAGNVTRNVARNYVHRENGEFEPIQDRVARIRAEQMREADEERTREVRAVNMGVRKILKETIEGLSKTKFVPKGAKQKDGTIHANEYTFNVIASTLKATMQLRDIVNGSAPQQSRNDGININVTQTNQNAAVASVVDRNAVAQAGRMLIQNNIGSDIGNAEQKTGKESRLVRALLEEATARTGNAED